MSDCRVTAQSGTGGAGRLKNRVQGRFQENSLPHFARIPAANTPVGSKPARQDDLNHCPANLLRLALAQAVGSTAAKAIYEILGHPISENERAWIAEIRDASGDTDPRLTTRSRSQLRAIFGK